MNEFWAYSGCVYQLYVLINVHACDIRYCLFMMRNGTQREKFQQSTPTFWNYPGTAHRHIAAPGKCTTHTVLSYSSEQVQFKFSKRRKVLMHSISISLSCVCELALVFHQLRCSIANHIVCVTIASVLLLAICLWHNLFCFGPWSLDSLLWIPSPVTTTLWPVAPGVLSTIVGLCL